LQRLQGEAAWARRLADLQVMPDPGLPEGEHAAFAALGRVLLFAVAELQLVFNEQGRVDHSEVAAIARSALVEEGAATDQAIRHMLRIGHILVDEFQDVSPEQVALLTTLTADWSPGDGRTLFAVGDPMQSIYLFRNSEVGLFLRVREQGIGNVQLEPMQLTSNFRSQAALVDWCNRAFRDIFPLVEDARRSAVGFLPSQAAREALAGEPVQVWAFGPGQAREEAERIALQIEALHGESPGLSIAILLRDRSLAPPILAALRERSIAVLGVDLAPLAAHASVQDLVALGCALLHAGDRAAWLAVLRAPFCGLLLADLLVLCGDDPDALLVERLQDAAVLAAMSADGRDRLLRCGPVLQRAWRQRGSEALDVSVRGLWQRLGGPACCRDESERLAAGQYLQALRGLLEARPHADGVALSQLAERLRDARPPEGQLPSGVVEVLTIHHSKGLEWDVVFLPGLGKRARSDRAPLMRWLQLPAEQGEDLLISAHSIGRDGEQDELGEFIKLLQAERQRNELGRLAYVAATRARQRLVLSGAARARGPEANSLLSKLWSAVSAQFAAVAQNDAGDGDGDGDGEDQHTPMSPVRQASPQWRRVAADFDPAQGLLDPPWLAGAQLSASMDGQSEALTPPALEFDWVGPAARAAGTVVHEELERLARDGDLLGADFSARRESWQQRLLELGMASEQIPSVVAQIAARMTQLRSDSTAQWLLATPHGEAQCEWRLSGFVDGKLQHAVIDRSFIDANGDRWVVDYKTGTHAGGGLEQFLARELERYRPQLQRYRALAERLGPQPVRAALYFPWLGRLCELTGEERSGVILPRP
jgi:ATP-dependent exoDNAse (exonuclease V) beta subunit